MVDYFLFASSVLLWGTTWLAIKLHLGPVAPVLSVGYRFGLAAVILFLFCLLTRKRLRFSGRNHFFLALQGAVMFSLSYCLAYFASQRLTSGLVAVIFSTMLMWSILNLRLFLRQPVRWLAFCGGVFGLAGICLIFWPDLKTFSASGSIYGLLLGMASTYLASVGNVIAARNSSAGIPVTQANAFGMAYGSALTFIFWFVAGGQIEFSWSAAYVLPLFYLSFFGSVLGFGCFIALIARIGADRASYVLLLTPIMALAMSTLFEGYEWTLLAALGVVTVLFGNILILIPAPVLQRLVPERFGRSS
ncbi:MAG: DMT family transporter [Deltaproteobacteria bacterium]|nr:DMT family transporter [Deltaproteobacteria bacterium]